MTDPVRIISCVDHTVRVVDRLGTLLTEIQACGPGSQARILDEPEQVGTEPLSSGFRAPRPCPLYEVGAGVVVRLPEPREGVLFLVSRLVFEHPSVADRTDLLRPGPKLWSGEKKLIGVLGLVRPRPRLVAPPAQEPVAVAPEEPLPAPVAPEEEVILELARGGLHDPTIAILLETSPHRVRSVRRAAGIAGHPRPHPPTPLKAQIAAAHGRGLRTAAIASEVGCSHRTVQQYLWELGLRAHRSRGSGQRG